MSMIQQACSWWSNHVGNASDYTPPHQDENQDLKSRAVQGAALGGAAGAAYGLYSGLVDEVVIEPVEMRLPVPEWAPPAQEIFGADYEALLETVTSRSEGSPSAQATMQYLGHLQTVNPDTTPATLESLYSTIENHFPRDGEVRQTLNVLSAYSEKNPGTNPYQPLAELIRDHDGAQGNPRRGTPPTPGFERLLDRFNQRHDIEAADLEQSGIKDVSRHTTYLGKFGMTGAILVGAGAGLAVGAAAGVAVGLAQRLITEGEN